MKNGSQSKIFPFLMFHCEKNNGVTWIVNEAWKNTLLLLFLSHSWYFTWKMMFRLKTSFPSKSYLPWEQVFCWQIINIYVFKSGIRVSFLPTAYNIESPLTAVSTASKNIWAHRKNYQLRNSFFCITSM